MPLIEKQCVKQTESVAGKPMTVYVAKSVQTVIPSFVGTYRKTPKWVVVREMYSEPVIVTETPTKKAAVAYIDANY